MTTAKIPLQYKSINQNFSETGVFIVIFDINVDFDTRYTLTLDDYVRVTFIDGNGFLDIFNIPDNPVPYLTIKGLPPNATKQQISNITVSNMATTVASCQDIKKITALKENGYTTFVIPLTSSSGENFINTGRFIVTFTVNVDAETQISYSISDKLILPFTNGSATIDLNSFFGLFDASLTNSAAGDYSRPIIKAGSIFDVNGTQFTINRNTEVTALVPNSSCFMYLYAYIVDGDVVYEYSTTVPSYNSNRKGWYNGTRRALWKMVYIHSANHFLFKTYIEDDLPQFGVYTLGIAKESDFSSIVSGKPLLKSVDGSSNPAADTITLDPGLYIFSLKGGSGGNGSMSGGKGGDGGLIREIVTLSANTSFSAFTGSSGSNATAAPVSGNFNIVTTKNYYNYPLTTIILTIRLL